MAHLRKSAKLGSFTAMQLDGFLHHATLRRLLEQLGDREQADQHRNELDAVRQCGDAEGEALDAGGEIQADRREQHAEGAGHQVLHRRIAAHGGHHRQAEQREREIFGRAELSRRARASSGAEMISTMTLKMPPMALATADMPSARPASPRFAIG